MIGAVQVLQFASASVVALTMTYFGARQLGAMPQRMDWQFHCVIFAGFLIAALSLVAGDPPLWVVFEIVALSVLIALLDLRLLIIPDVLTLALAVAGVRFALVTDASILTTLSGGSFGFILLAVIYGYYEHIRQRSGLGFGDVKLMGAIGLIVGPYQVPLVMAVGAAATLVAGLVVGFLATRRRPLQTRRFPFAPGLLAAMLASLVLDAA